MKWSERWSACFHLEAPSGPLEKFVLGAVGRVVQELTWNASVGAFGRCSEE
jgi:hypothetical protein